MQINDALNLVRAKFTSESGGDAPDDAAQRYQDAFSEFPVTMEVATHILAVQLIQHNMAQQMQTQQQAGAEGGDAAKS